MIYYASHAVFILKRVVLFAFHFHAASPGCIDMKVVHKGDNLSIYQKTENLNLVISVAKSLGCQLVNIGSKDIIDGRYVMTTSSMSNESVFPLQIKFIV
jgi:hypothetical protein